MEHGIHMISGNVLHAIMTVTLYWTYLTGSQKYITMKLHCIVKLPYKQFKGASKKVRYIESLLYRNIFLWKIY